MSVKKYCYCENNCKYETLDKEEILAAIANAIETGTVGECDTGFITTIKTINGQPLRFFVGEQSEYAALENKTNLFAIITNDITKDTLLNALTSLQTEFREFKEGVLTGNVVAKNADHAETADNAARASYASNADKAESASVLSLPAAKIQMIGGVADLWLEKDAVYLFNISETTDFPTVSTVSKNFVMYINTLYNYTYAGDEDLRYHYETHQLIYSKGGASQPNGVVTYMKIATVTVK